MIKAKFNIAVEDKEQINISFLPVIDLNIFKDCGCLHLGWLVFYWDIWFGNLEDLIL